MSSPSLSQWRRAEGANAERRVEFNTVRPHEALAWNRPLEVHLGQADPTTPNFDRAGYGV